MQLTQYLRRPCYDQPPPNPLYRHPRPLQHFTQRQPAQSPTEQVLSRTTVLTPFGKKIFIFLLIVWVIWWIWCLCDLQLGTKGARMNLLLFIVPVWGAYRGDIDIFLYTMHKCRNICSRRCSCRSRSMTYKSLCYLPPPASGRNVIGFCMHTNHAEDCTHYIVCIFKFILHPTLTLFPYNSSKMKCKNYIAQLANYESERWHYSNFA